MYPLCNTVVRSFGWVISKMEDALLCCNRLALWVSNVEGSSFFTTVSDRDLANDICFYGRLGQSEQKAQEGRTMGFEYRGNPRTSLAAFFAMSADSNETKA